MASLYKSGIPSSLIDTFEITLTREGYNEPLDLEYPKFSHAIELAGGINATDEEIISQAFFIEKVD